MADFTLTAAANDSLVGTADVVDDFLIAAAGDLVGTDTVTGGDGDQTIDQLVLGAAMTLSAADFAGVGGIERIVFNAGGGSSITLSNAMVASNEYGFFFVAGGTGADTLDASGVLATTLRISGGGGNDLLTAGSGADRLSGGASNDTLLGGGGNDALNGGSGNDSIEGGIGLDRVDGGAGNDTVVYAGDQFTASDLVADESGVLDTLQLTGAVAVAMNGVLAARVIGVERILFGSGADTFTPNPEWADGVETGVVTVNGGDGNDSLNAGAVVPLTPVAFRLEGGNGIDTLTGSSRNDTLDGGTGRSVLNGGAGDDLLIVAAASLTSPSAIVGGINGAGGDTLRVVGSGTIAQNALTGIGGIEIVELDDSGHEVFIPDALVAGVSSAAFDLRVRGGAGDDRIIASTLAVGRDLIVEAGDGDDSIIGGPGDDTVSPGAGVDVAVLFSGTDRVIFGAGQLNSLDIVSADNLFGDRIDVTLAPGRTLSATAFSGVSGFDTFGFTHLTDSATAAVRLPSTLVSQSGLTSVAVSLTGPGNIVVDGRAATGTWTLNGGAGDDVAWGGTGVNTMNGSSGLDTMIGGDGGDFITMSGGAGDRDLALITAATDGTVDINGTLSVSQLAGADRVTGLGLADNYIAVDWQALGLPNSTTLVVADGQNISLLGYGAVRLNTGDDIASNAFGSLTAVRNAVGARLTGNQVALDERTIFVIGGATNTQFGVYYFEDRDDNATIDAADVLMLLAIGDTDVPGGLSPGRGFTLTTLDLG